MKLLTHILRLKEALDRDLPSDAEEPVGAIVVPRRVYDAFRIELKSQVRFAADTDLPYIVAFGIKVYAEDEVSIEFIQSAP